MTSECLGLSVLPLVDSNGFLGLGLVERDGLRVLQIISSSATSGAERHVFCLSSLLKARGNYVEVVCPQGGWLPQELRNSCIPVIEVDMKGPGWFRTNAFMLKRIREAQIDIVHSHLTRATYFGAITGMLRSIPAIATVHIANHDQVYKRMARNRNRLVAVSNYVRGMLHGRGIPDKYIDIVYNGTDFHTLSAASTHEVKSEIGIDPKKRVIGLVGRVCREKGHLLMIQAMREVSAQFPDAHLMFVGKVEPQFKYEFDAAVHDAGIGADLTLTGVRHDVPRLLDACELTTMPSHQETFGVAAIEAMARSKAVVASRIGGLPEVVRHEQTGILIDLRPDQLSEAVCSLLADDEMRHGMGTLGRMIVEQKFTLKQMGDRLEEVYRSAIAS